MTRDDYIKLHEQTFEAIQLVKKHGFESCIVESTDSRVDAYWQECGHDFDYSGRYLRARLKPTKKLLPWSSLDEVPLTHWFRWRGIEDLLRVEGFNPFNTALPIRIGKGIPSFQELLDHYEHTAPCDKYSDLIWLPCGKEVVE